MTVWEVEPVEHGLLFVIMLKGVPTREGEA